MPSKLCTKISKTRQHARRNMPPAQAQRMVQLQRIVMNALAEMRTLTTANRPGQVAAPIAGSLDPNRQQQPAAVGQVQPFASTDAAPLPQQPQQQQAGRTGTQFVASGTCRTFENYGNGILATVRHSFQLDKTPVYLSSLVGNKSSGIISGSTSVFECTPQGFKVFVHSRTETLTAEVARERGYMIVWTAVRAGNGASAASDSVGQQQS